MPTKRKISWRRGKQYTSPATLGGGGGGGGHNETRTPQPEFTLIFAGVQFKIRINKKTLTLTSIKK